MREIRYTGQKAYTDSVIEKPMGYDDCDQWAIYDVIRAILPERVILSRLDDGRIWIDNDGLGPYLSLKHQTVSLTPPIIPQTFSVIEGDAEGNGDFLASDVSFDKALSYLK